MAHVFISYAHRDGRDSAVRINDLLTAEGHQSWLDRERLEAGASWTEGIEQAINSADVVLALLTQASYRSDICRAEQLRALRRGKRVVPILIQADADRPIHLETRQFADLSRSADFREVLDLLDRGESAVLPERYRTERVTRPSFSFAPIARPADLERLRNALVREQPSARICLTALRAMSGAGKTVLAAMVFEDPVVRDAFPDGRIWLTIGQQPSDAHLLAQLREIPRVLGESLDSYDSLPAAENQLRTTLRDKAVFIVLDDVWDARAVGAFLADAPRCCVLMTTRDERLAKGARAATVTLDTLDEPQSRALLADRAGLAETELPAIARELTEECGNLPLALAMVGAQLRGGRVEDWEDALARFRRAKLDRVSAFLPEYDRYPDLYSAIHVSVERLVPPDRTRYLDWAVFPPDVPIPAEAFAALWHEDVAGARETMRAWTEASLAVRDDQGRLTVHDLQHDYARASHLDLAQTHRRLVQGYRLHAAGHLSAVPFDKYVERYLFRHLDEAGEAEAARELLLRPEWLRRKLAARSPVDLIDDYGFTTVASQPHGMIQEALRLCSHILARSPRQLHGQLIGRLRAEHDPVVQEFVARLLADGSPPWFEPLEATLTRPGSNLVRTMDGHEGGIYCLAVSEDGRIAYSGGDPARICVWDVETGRLLCSLDRGSGGIYGLGLYDGGRRLLAAYGDGWLRYWNPATEQCEREVHAHPQAIADLALTPDGALAVTGALDPTPKVWDTATGKLIATLEGHRDSVRFVRISPDGSRVLTISEDGTDKWWGLPEGRLLRTAPLREAEGSSRGFVSNGDVLVSREGGTEIWDFESRAVRRRFPGMPDVVKVARTGRHAISTEPLRVWDLDTGVCVGAVSDTRAVCHDYSHAIVAYLPDRREILVGGTALRQWRLLPQSSAVPSASNDTLRDIAICGATAVSIRSNGEVSVWDLRRRTVVESWPVGSYGSRVALSEDSRFIVVNTERAVEVWSRETRCKLAEIRESYPERMAVSPDGDRVVIGGFSTFSSYRIPGGEQIPPFENIDDIHIAKAVAISSEAAWGLTGIEHDIRIWDLETNEITGVLQGHDAEVTWLEFSLDWLWGFSAGRDDTVRVWDLAEQTLRRTVHLGFSLSRFAVLPDLRHVVGLGPSGLCLVGLYEPEALLATLTFDAPIQAFAYSATLQVVMLSDAAGVVHFVRVWV